MIIHCSYSQTAQNNSNSLTGNIHLINSSTVLSIYHIDAVSDGMCHKQQFSRSWHIIQIVTGSEVIGENWFSRGWEMLHKVEDRG